MSQPVVTDYFAKRRRRACAVQATKRLKLTDNPSLEKQNIVTAIEQIREVKKSITKTKRTRTAKQNLQFENAPENSKEIAKDQLDVVTSCVDDHDVPHTPSKRSKRTTTKKRERTSPKKINAYKFEAKEIEEEKLEPNIEFKTKPRKTAKKKLALSEAPKPTEKDVNESNTGTKEAKKPEENITTKPAKQNKENAQKIINASSKTEKKLSARELRKQNRENANKLAEGLLKNKQQSSAALKESIKTKSKLGDLQETLLKIREQKKKRQESDKIRKHNEKMRDRVKEINKKPIEAAPSKREFAYEKLHSLAQSVPEGLMLPYKYKILMEMFKSTDTVISMLFNRQQTTTWELLQKSVRDMTRKNYEWKHLAQIKTVFTEAYLMRQEKGIISYNSEIRPSDYQLTLEPILNTEECRAFGDNEKKLTSNMLVRRRHHFNVQLLNIVKQHHKTFLGTLETAVDVPDDKILRWHPQFALDQVPEITEAELPKSPLDQQERCSTAKDALAKARNKLTKKAVEALKKVAERVTPEKMKKSSSSPLIMEANNNTPSPKNLKTESALRGVSKSLLQKIKEKEAQTKAKAMTRPNEDVERIARLRKLPDVARAVRMLFVTEKKAALPYDLVCEKLIKCASGISTAVDVQGYLELLVREMPRWASIAKVRKVQYLKIDRNREMSVIIQEVENKIKIAEKC